MSAPRNKTALERGQNYRAGIRAFMDDWIRMRGPLARPPYACEIQRAFPNLAVRTLQWHMACIRKQAMCERLATYIDGAQRNLSSPEDAVL